MRPDQPGERWTSSDFDDGHWAQGKAGFGVHDLVTPPATIGTPWTTPEIWLRKTIEVPGPLEFNSAGVIVRHDEDVEVFVNGTMVFSAPGFNTKWIGVRCQPANSRADTETGKATSSRSTSSRPAAGSTSMSDSCSIQNGEAHHAADRTGGPGPTAKAP